MHKRLFLIIITLHAIYLSSIHAQMMGGGRQSAMQIERLQVRELFNRSLYGGRFEPIQTYPQPSLVSGVIRAMHVRPGDYVRTGQLLYTVQQTVVAQNYLPTPIYAQNSGMVVHIDLNVGERVQANTSVITLAKTDKIKIRLAISEKDFHQLSLGDSVYLPGRIESANALIEATQERIRRSEDPQFKESMREIIRQQRQIITQSQGTITYLPIIPNYQTGLFTIEVTFDYAPDLFFGKFERVELRTNRTHSIAVRQSAILVRYGRSHVLQVDENNIVSYRQVELGEAFGDYVVILTGIEAGEEIIRELPGRIPQSGDTVRVSRPNQQPENTQQQGNNQTQNNQQQGNNPSPTLPRN
ncbi:efflux RND transporter periplasmic adaptor subunit [Entomospira culicis]|uniref:HlyD family efflux transporter periplasmic adaptor subunit n=1 Tax=Entomospira culicis TaxID=2719989 RepID=A0A968KUK5_9SPIO|nr:HlyD family efflux transporter periplasmic adaptor subunit [Entomospira culicis]NIZ19000.1 HlyD family efflux transporter periplasmic adaptor subunit [Entomospira culicis]NIZ69215.1 HlyD family efflux transporter periplasmic adaptor subunit [Entomospira culicis]WDI37801.1 HlyD family efflux transporter periplasmic adaptor subunit [Entomospira culicis]WDI39429.1 HlyD family efflux transporter periplasmic adaptor subunit [Entomospira culicis]